MHNQSVRRSQGEVRVVVGDLLDREHVRCGSQVRNAIAGAPEFAHLSLRFAHGVVQARAHEVQFVHLASQALG